MPEKISGEKPGIMRTVGKAQLSTQRSAGIPVISTPIPAAGIFFAS